MRTRREVGAARTVPWRDQAEPRGGRRRKERVRGLQRRRDLGGLELGIEESGEWGDWGWSAQR